MRATRTAVPPAPGAKLRRIDRLAARLRQELPDDTRLLVTGDHGMIDAPREHWVVAEDIPGSLDGVTLLAGEGRYRQLYAEAADVAAIAARWSRHLGDRAWVVTRDEAIDAGWFGPTDPARRSASATCSW